jgi:spore coat protein U domain-containing protein, fimbrial subunit CupE1/2/3/6
MLRTIALALAALFAAGAAHAQAQPVSTTTFSVSARVEAGCKVTASDLNLGAYSAHGGIPRQVAALMRATCTPNTTYDVGLNKGRSRSAISGEPTGTVTGIGTGLEVDHTLFGRFPAAQVVPAGDYADTVTVRVHY